MGKTTLMHPVSLNVIRGAAEYHGFKLLKISQTHYMEKSQIARYKVKILSVPKDLKGAAPERIKQAFEASFGLDVEVVGWWLDKKGNYTAEITTRVFQDPKDREYEVGERLDGVK